jgi:hypothetical protein
MMIYTTCRRGSTPGSRPDYPPVSIYSSSSSLSHSPPPPATPSPALYKLLLQRCVSVGNGSKGGGAGICVQEYMCGATTST